MLVYDDPDNWIVKIKLLGLYRQLYFYRKRTRLFFTFFKGYLTELLCQFLQF